METDFDFMVKARNELVCELGSTHEPMEIIVSGLDGLSRMPWQAGNHSLGMSPLCARWLIRTLPLLDRKSARYTNLDTHHTFQSVVIETLGPFSDSARDFCK